jgi:hypothetical protein
MYMNKKLPLHPLFNCPGRQSPIVPGAKTVTDTAIEFGTDTNQYFAASDRVMGLGTVSLLTDTVKLVTIVGILQKTRSW